MRYLTILSTLLVTAAAMPAFAQFSGLKDREKGTLNNAVNQHNQDLENALNGDNPQPPQPQQPAIPAIPGALKTGWLTRTSPDGKTKTRLYFAYPANLSKDHAAPGLLVLQEWWGVNEDIQARTREFAQHGLYAVAPDLYDGKVADDAKTAATLKSAMKNETALIDMKNGLDLLTEESTNGVVDPSHIAAIGWCMGGEQALLLSLADPRVKATGIFYGPLVTDAEQLKKLQGPVLGIFGNNDTHPSPADVQKFKDALTTAGKTDVTIYQFDGVGHAFASKSGARIGAYNPEVSKQAWDKMWTWVTAKLPTK